MFSLLSSWQALLRGRFLRNIGRSDSEYSSVGVRELGQLSQHRPVSGLMYASIFHKLYIQILQCYLIPSGFIFKTFVCVNWLHLASHIY